MLHTRDKVRLLWLSLIRPFCFRSDGSELPANDKPAHVDTDITRPCALAPVRIGRREFHLNRRDAAMRRALEVSEIPSRRHDIRSHALDRVHKHTGTVNCKGLAIQA